MPRDLVQREARCTGVEFDPVLLPGLLDRAEADGVAVERDHRLKLGHEQHHPVELRPHPPRRGGPAYSASVRIDSL